MFKNKIESKQQIISKNDKKAPKLNSDNTRINWNNSIDSIIGNIRGLTPKPGAWTILYNNQKYIGIKVDKEKNKILNMHSLSHYDRLRRSISVKYF